MSTSNPPDVAEPSKRLQMADLARLAGVATSTVSRALNGSKAVNESTRLRIEELARSLNYTVNLGAKNLRLGDNKTFGVVIPMDAHTRQHISDPFFLSIVGSIADALTEQGYDLLLSRSVDPTKKDYLGALYDTGRVGGVIVIGQWGNHEQLNSLAARRLPMVVWGAQLPQQLYCSVGSDNLEGGRCATTHLISTGRNRIVFLGDTQLPEVDLRYAGYLKAHAESGVAVDDRLLVQVPFVMDTARQLFGEFLDRGIAFDGIFAASDMLAMTMVNEMALRGMQVPRDVGVVGYDDIAAAASFHPPLTTIRQPIDLAGHYLASNLLAIVRGESVPPTLLPTTLVVRGTSVARALEDLG